ncbi:MAG TPA: penicillin-binding protein 2 [Acetobacteraceae bacterium]|nr:penicillin-binding protein 2 [Acetobacteraceae bacterium]
MTDDPKNPPNAPPPDSLPLRAGRATPSRRRGAARADAVPRMETVRLTAGDLNRRAALEITRSRLVISAAGFLVLFLAVVLKLADATVIRPVKPHRPERPVAALLAKPKDMDADALSKRAMITDRNGQILAISLPTAALFADPRQIVDPAAVAAKLTQVLPTLDQAQVRQRLSETGKQFVFIDRRITPQQQIEINNLGIPGIDFEPTEERHYPMGRVAAHVLGGVDVDEHGVAGVEKWFDKRLMSDSRPLRLSIDVRVQGVVREELITAMDTFEAIGGCGLVMDVNTGEVLAMVSLPDYDANQFGSAPPDDRFNRAVTGMYEPGSTFKLQTASMALDSGLVHIWDEFDASHPITVGRFTITDFEGKKRWLYLPEVLAYSSNLGAAHIAVTVGSEIQRNFLRSMGMFQRIGIQLPEAGLPIVPPAANWKELTTITVGFGHGIAVSPLHVVVGTAAVANGGIRLRPTILAHMADDPPPEGLRVMQPSTSETMRKLMRLVVTDGFGKTAEVAGYYPGGKTGTAEKVGAHGAYRKHANVAAFTSVFPMNAPRYAVYMMLDEPHGNKATYGYATAGWVVAPAAGKVIARIGPMLGLLPDVKDAPQINQALFIPLQPGRPAGAVARGPGSNVHPAVTAPVHLLPPARASQETIDGSPRPTVVRAMAVQPVADH